ncbi:MAG: hypothetical protein ACREWG_02505 [Gammaproteobacteria bacterium]
MVSDLMVNLALCLSLATCSAVGVAEGAKRPVGFVLSVTGSWLLNNTEKIAVGRAVRPGDSLRAEAATGHPNIVISLYNGKVKCCPNASQRDCTSPISIPDIQHPPTSLARAWDAIQALFGSSEGSRFTLAHAISRGGTLSETVLKLGAGRIDLGPLLAGLDAGAYELAFEPAVVADNDKRSGITMRVTLNAVVQYDASGLMPGLYRVTKGGSGSDAWVLIASADKYEALIAEFDKVSEITSAWQTDVKVADKRRVLRAWLYHLASSGST